MIIQNKVIFLSGQLSFYYNARTVFIILFIAFFIISVLYGRKIGIAVILGKKTGFRKKREIGLMKAGQSIKRRRVSNVKEDRYILHTSASSQSNELEETARVEETEKLDKINTFEETQNNGTVLLKKNDMDMQKNFYNIKDIIIVHGDPIPDDN